MNTLRVIIKRISPTSQCTHHRLQTEYFCWVLHIPDTEFQFESRRHKARGELSEVPQPQLPGQLQTSQPHSDLISTHQ